MVQLSRETVNTVRPMKPPPISLGAVYEAQWSPYLVRVVAFDESVVMYDVWWPHKNAWAMSKLVSPFSYYLRQNQWLFTIATRPASNPPIKLKPFPDNGIINCV
jgi:hypothetical protein